jgi:hypothetical protein
MPGYWKSSIALIVASVLVLYGCAGSTAPAPSPAAATEEPPAAAATEEPTARPTPMPTFTPDPTVQAAVDATAEAAAAATAEAVEGEVSNEIGGFAVVPPAGWQVGLNVESGASGMLFLVPEEATDSVTDTAFIALNGGAPAAVLEQPNEPGLVTLSPEEALDIFFEQFQQDVTAGEREDITLAGAEGQAVTITGSDPAMGEVAGKVVLLRIDAQRILLIFGASPVDEWDEQVFDEVLASLRFFQPSIEPVFEVPVQTPSAMPEEDEDSEGSEGSEQPAAPDEPEATAESSQQEGSIGQVREDTFPLPESARDVRAVYSATGGVVMYTTPMDSEEIADFYREVFTAQGATERTLLTVLSEGVLNLVFDEWPAAEGQAVVIQTVPLGPDETNVTIRFEDV